MSTNLLSRLSQNRYRHISRLNQENKSLVEDLSLQKSFAMEAQASAEQAVIDKSRFLATASHDLRQPLHALFESLDKSMAALNAMFDSLLDVSRLDANVVEPECEEVSLESIFDVLSQEFSPIAEEKGLYFLCEYAGETVLTNRTLFARILRNLISKSIKFTNSGGVSKVASYQGPNLRISVRDTGQGIPLDERKNVFHEFYQLHDNRQPKGAGIGLGLSIVCRLCSLLGIDITLSVPEDGGTEITMLICDLQLANGSNGIDDIGLLCESIGQDLPALLISAASGPEELLEIEASLLRCLTKPVSPQSLQEVILTMLDAQADETDKSFMVSHS